MIPVAAAPWARWAAQLSLAVRRGLYWRKFLKSDDNAVLVERLALEAAAGSTVGNAVSPGMGQVGDSLLTEPDEVMTYYSDVVLLEQKRRAIRLRRNSSRPGGVVERRLVAVSIFDCWLRETLDSEIFAGLGAAPTRAVTRNGDEGALELVKRAVDYAKTGALDTGIPPVAPVMACGQPYFVAVIQGNLASQLPPKPVGSSHGEAQVVDNSPDPVLAARLGIWHGTIVHESPFVQLASPETASNLLLGVAAGTLTWGKPPAWSEQETRKHCLISVAAVWNFHRAMIKGTARGVVSIVSSRAR